MKQLTCEMCGSTDLLKQDGVFVCQTCGCKYSVEEAKRMMIEGTVDVSGSTVKVDNTAFVEKYLANARRAKQKEDWDETEKYYNMVEQNDPDNIEAIFYSAYGKAKSTLVDQDVYKRQAAFKVLKNCISVIDDHYKIERREENEVAIKSIAEDLGKMINSNFVYTEWKNGYGIVTRTNKQETYTMFAWLLDGFKESIDNIQKIDDQAYLHYALISLCESAKTVSWANRTTMINLMNKWIDEEKSELKALERKAVEEYWNEHTEEKNKLLDEKSSLISQMTEIEKQKADLPERRAVLDIEQQIEEKTKEKNSLGMFKGKEKKAIQTQIDELNHKLFDAKDTLSKAERTFNSSLQQLKTKLAGIENELTRPR